MTKSPRKNVPDVGIELGAACMPSEHASDRSTAPGIKNVEKGYLDTNVRVKSFKNATIQNVKDNIFFFFLYFDDVSYHNKSDIPEKLIDLRVAMGNFVYYNFLKLQYISYKMRHVSPLRVQALSCNSNITYATL